MPHEKPSFETWLLALNLSLGQHYYFCVCLDDIPDLPLRVWYNSGLSVSDALDNITSKFTFSKGGCQ